MNNKSLLVACPLLLTLAACTSMSGSEPPAVSNAPAKKAPAKKTANNKPAAPAVAKKLASSPNTATYAIESVTNNFKDEPNLPAFRAEPLMPPADIPPTPTPAPESVPAAPSTVATAAVPRFSIEDATIPNGTPPAVLALISESDRSRNSGDLDAAVVVMERALRIDSRNPTLTYKLAQLRIKQNKPQLAEELAGKAALLAGGNLDLKRKSWLLIAEARQMQQNPQGAKEAKAKADSFFGR
ncbi:tetratricopeptide repeat protein [Methylomonas sp. 2BW1-5-20]|uniref:tetratricopeptide repeat protein n=1 Tax=Methylomonas sp. 2BW1-5-20 TaxID=3376686 RepID=UPI00404D72F1